MNPSQLISTEFSTPSHPLPSLQLHLCRLPGSHRRHAHVTGTDVATTHQQIHKHGIRGNRRLPPVLLIHILTTTAHHLLGLCRLHHLRALPTTRLWLSHRIVRLRGRHQLLQQLRGCDHPVVAPHSFRLLRHLPRKLVIPPSRRRAEHLLKAHSVATRQGPLVTRRRPRVCLQFALLSPQRRTSTSTTPAHGIQRGIGGGEGTATIAAVATRVHSRVHVAAACQLRPAAVHGHEVRERGPRVHVRGGRGTCNPEIRFILNVITI